MCVNTTLLHTERESRFHVRRPARDRVGAYRTGASQLLAFRQTGTHLHLINAPAEESRSPPPLLPGIPRCRAAAWFVEVQTVFSHT